MPPGSEGVNTLVRRPATISLRRDVGRVRGRLAPDPSLALGTLLVAGPSLVNVLDTIEADAMAPTVAPTVA